MDYQDILVESREQIGVITFNSPKTINALSKNMIKELTLALQDFSTGSETTVIVIKANGKHFCSGHNLKEMVNGDPSDYRFIFEQCTRLMKLVHSIPQIVIAQVHGIATAAGCQLVATCDLAVADETARFGTPESRSDFFAQRLW